MHTTMAIPPFVNWERLCNISICSAFAGTEAANVTDNEIIATSKSNVLFID
jgi:hypothetical protein